MEWSLSIPTTSRSGKFSVTSWPHSVTVARIWTSWASLSARIYTWPRHRSTQWNRPINTLLLDCRSVEPLPTLLIGLLIIPESYFKAKRGLKWKTHYNIYEMSPNLGTRVESSLAIQKSFDSAAIMLTRLLGFYSGSPTVKFIFMARLPVLYWSFPLVRFPVHSSFPLS